MVHSVSDRSRRVLSGLMALALVAAIFTASVDPAAAAEPPNGPDKYSLDRLYSAYFLRTPDEGGIGYWRQQMAAGRISLNGVAQNFSQSAEFRARYGPLDNAGFVRLVYSNVMDREPDAGGLAHWTGVLNSGRTRGLAMIGFSDSPEFKVRAGVWDRNPAPTPPPVPSAPAGSYRYFMSNPNGTPVKFNSCGPMHVVANFAHADASARQAVNEALATLAQATGRPWVLIGETNEAVSMSSLLGGFARPHAQARYGTGYAPILINWDAAYRGDRAGLGSAVTLRNPANGEMVHVTGVVAMKPGALANHTDLVTTLMHEIGHVYGLDHPTTSGQIMSTDWSRRLDWGPGDLYGLAQLTAGRSSC